MLQKLNDDLKKKNNENIQAYTSDFKKKTKKEVLSLLYSKH